MSVSYNVPALTKESRERRTWLKYFIASRLWRNMKILTVLSHVFVSLMVIIFVGDHAPRLIWMSGYGLCTITARMEIRLLCTWKQIALQLDGKKCPMSIQLAARDYCEMGPRGFGQFESTVNGRIFFLQTMQLGPIDAAVPETAFTQWSHRVKPCKRRPLFTVIPTVAIVTELLRHAYHLSRWPVQLSGPLPNPGYRSWPTLPLLPGTENVHGQVPIKKEIVFEPVLLFFFFLR